MPTKLCWLDIRAVGTEAKPAIIEEAVHQRVDGIVASEPGDLAGLPPTVTKILLPGDDQRAVATASADIDIDIVIVPGEADGWRNLAAARPGTELGRFVEVTDALTLEEACAAARDEAWSVLHFRDPTKIPLEIVIAAAHGTPGTSSSRPPTRRRRPSYSACSSTVPPA